MAHLAHKLPWNTLASRLELIQDRKDLTPRITDLFSKDYSEDHLRHFLEALSKTIREFAVTERRKYPERYPAREKGILFPSSLFNVALPFKELQDISQNDGNTCINLHEATRIEAWIAKVGQEPSPQYDHSYNEVMALLLCERMDLVLELAQHPRIRLDKLDQASGNYQYGFSEVVVHALQAYMCFNLIYCKPELWSGGHRMHMELASFKSVMSRLTASTSGDLIYLHPRRGLFGYPCKSSFDPFEDLNKLQDYLKDCFRMLVRYEMLEREASRTPDWARIYHYSLSRHRLGRNYMFDFAALPDFVDGLCI